MMAMQSHINVVDSTPRQIQNNDNGKRRRRAHPIHSDSSSASSTASSVTPLNYVTTSNTKSRANAPNTSPRKPSRRERKRLHAAHKQRRMDSISDEEKDRYVALDCEMVGVGHGGQQSALARVTLINWDAEILLDCFVRPDCEVVDYRTFVSGITKEDLESEYAISMDECQWMVADMLYNKVLVGHALKNDLHALGISHPWYDTRDTAKYEPFMKVRFDNGILWPRKLKELAKEKLGRDIQLPGQPHSAYEDALGALDLYKKNRAKWEKAMEYKLNKTRQIENLTVTQNGGDDEEVVAQQ